MTLQYFATFIIFVALLLQIAVDRAPDLPETHDNQAARKVLMAGILVLLIYVGRLSWLGVPANEIPLIGVFLICIAEIAFCVNRLFPTQFINFTERFHRKKEPRHE